MTALFAAVCLVPHRMCVGCVCVLSHASLFVTPWTVARQASLSTEFSRQEYWSELPFPSHRGHPNLDILHFNIFECNLICSNEKLTPFFSVFKVSMVSGVKGLPWSLSGKQSACNAGYPGSIPGFGRSHENGIATRSRILAWRIPWTKEPGGLPSMGLQIVRHD